MAFTFVSALAALAVAAVANAESHTISFDNKCGKGTPQLIQGGKVISTGQPYTSNGPFSAGIAYLQTGECLFNGENCALLEMTLGNPTCPGCGSSTDISLIPPHALNVPVAFSYQGGCDGQGATCTTANCNTAFFVPDDTQVQVACQTDNVNLLITFCPDGDSPAPSSSAAPAPAPSSSKPAQSSASEAAPSSSSVPSPSSSAVQASPASSQAAAAPTVVAAAPAPSASSSATVPNRGTCKNKTRRSASRMAREHRRRLTGLSH
ncbi:hypothetical protein GLOTRDRAFT_58158 [Gloeophyllum trabeum ATCC 11539]|uniref:Glycopeptide n=1 Tax=Gloeophyllum trabeum (strain ATCC 11539 / FP-39264 / Madison 617) TaxID=670483 RepID=S7QAW7_GLOTA|nr:uncharacterized protein GLOTRDRAFT_58158 [Gloeophyllum trabeum ATCC 11539]EPQ57056.1 hypothetical protein GLOTRDRAFT_58158 [Gloeophyllum trabeum ATCC 11539]